VNVEEILARLEALGCRPRPRSNGHHTARCPAHDDRRPSLDVVVGRDAGTLVHCFAGCTPEGVCDALGIHRAALAPFSVERLRSPDVSLAQLLAPDSPPVVSLLVAHAAGELEPVPITLDLPPRAGRMMRAVATDLALLFGLRSAVGDKRSLPYATSWAAERLSEDPRNLGRTLHALVKRGTIGRAGVLPPLDGRSRGTTKYRLPSELAGRIDVPSRERAREAASRVAAVGGVEPLPELHHGEGVAVAELGRAPVEVAERRLLAMGDRAGDLVVVGSEDSAEGVEMVHGNDGASRGGVSGGVSGHVSRGVSAGAGRR
jgi:hypothetical protein